MNLIEVHSITATADPEIFNFDITADIGRGGPERIPFAYNPNDGALMNAEITAWWMMPENENFPVGAYVPPPAPDPLTLTLTKRQVVRAMIVGASIADPDAFIENAINSMTDQTAASLARADWRYAPYFLRTHDLFSNPELLAATGFTSAQIDGLWAIGVDQPA